MVRQDGYAALDRAPHARARIGRHRGGRHEGGGRREERRMMSDQHVRTHVRSRLDSFDRRVERDGHTRDQARRIAHRHAGAIPRLGVGSRKLGQQRALERAGGDRRDRLGKQPRRTARQTFPTLGILLVLLRCNHGAAPSLVFELDFRSHVTR